MSGVEPCGGEPGGIPCGGGAKFVGKLGLPPGIPPPVLRRQLPAAYPPPGRLVRLLEPCRMVVVSPHRGLIAAQYHACTLSLGDYASLFPLIGHVQRILEVSIHRFQLSEWVQRRVEAQM